MKLPFPTGATRVRPPGQARSQKHRSRDHDAKADGRLADKRWRSGNRWVHAPCTPSFSTFDNVGQQQWRGRALQISKTANLRRSSRTRGKSESRTPCNTPHRMGSVRPARCRCNSRSSHAVSGLSFPRRKSIQTVASTTTIAYLTGKRPLRKSVCIAFPRNFATKTTNRTLRMGLRQHTPAGLNGGFLGPGTALAHRLVH